MRKEIITRGNGEDYLVRWPCSTRAGAGCIYLEEKQLTWLSDWLSVAGCSGDWWADSLIFLRKTGAGERTRTADLLITNQHYVFAKHENSDSHSRARAR